MIISSSWRSFWEPLFLNERSLKLKERGPSPLLQSLYSYCYSYWINVPLISKSGLLEFKNSSVFNMDHLYFLMKYAAKTEDDLDWPLTECTNTDSYFLIAFSIKSKIAFVVVSFVSKMT